MSLGQVIKNFREAKGWSQIELAEQLDVSQSAVAGWENERHGPNPKQRMKLCEVFDTDLNTLYEIKPK